jgi:hypothetical protein
MMRLTPSHRELWLAARGPRWARRADCVSLVHACINAQLKLPASTEPGNLCQLLRGARRLRLRLRRVSSEYASDLTYLRHIAAGTRGAGHDRRRRYAKRWIARIERDLHGRATSAA